MSIRKRLRSIDESSKRSVPEPKKVKQNGLGLERSAALASTGLRTSDLRDPAPLFDDVVSMGLLPADRERQITVEEARAGTQGWLHCRWLGSLSNAMVCSGSGKKGEGGGAMCAWFCSVSATLIVLDDMLCTSAWYGASQYTPPPMVWS